MSKTLRYELELHIHNSIQNISAQDTKDRTQTRFLRAILKEIQS